ncbi:MAG: hypothetical protein AB199_03870 [Parcubacteria bacterium C7867-004]|nr:MAG: hypothetical protein AB199_03870 [Parcubacteria bacterium C7867-004]
MGGRGQQTHNSTSLQYVNNPSHCGQNEQTADPFSETRRPANHGRLATAK